MMLIGFKILELTDDNRDAAYDFIKSVCFILTGDIDDLLANWQYVNIYSFDLTQEQLDAQPFPTEPLYSGPDNTAINNLDGRLELSYIDELGNFQMIALGFTEHAYVNNFVRRALKVYEDQKIIYYTPDSNSGDYNQPDFTKLDYSSNDFLAG